MNLLSNKAISVLLCLTALLLASCDPDPADPDPDPIVSFYPSGVMQIERIIYGPTTSSDDTVDHMEAYFTTTPGDSISPNLTNAGTVLYNTDSLYADFTSPDTADWIYERIYQSNELLPMNVPSIWTVTGSSTIPAFTYTHAGTRPDLAAPLPDTLHKLTGWTVNFPTFISGADSVNIQLLGLTELVKGAPISAGSITFSPAELQSLGTDQVFMQVTGYSFANEVLSGKRFWFIKDLVVFHNAELTD